MFEVTYTNKHGVTKTVIFNDEQSAYTAVARYQEFGDFGGYNPNVDIKKVNTNK